MLRVVIADDEERICKLIQILADWEGLGMQVAGTASTGPDALALCRQHMPDILITDIRMPGFDGLSLIAQAKALCPALEIIIISGYAQFDYAQTAIKHGVGDYLLKPINQEALNATLAKMGARCAARMASLKSLEQLRDAAGGQPQRRDSLIKDLLAGECDAKDVAALDRDYDFGTGGDAWQAFVLTLDYEPDQLSAASADTIRDKALDILMPAAGPLCGGLLTMGHEGVALGLMNYEKNAESAVRKRLREALNQLVASQVLWGPVVFSLALGRAVTDAALLSEALQSAMDIVPERLVEGTERLLVERPRPATLDQGHLIARYAQDIDHALDVLGIPEADGAVDSLAHAAFGAHGWEILSLVRSAGTVFISRAEDGRHDEALRDFERRLQRCGAASDLFLALRQAQREQIEAAQRQRQDLGGQSIRMAKRYIQRHYAEPLTLETVSGEIGLSVSYFSSLFKKETGEGFARYLSHVRMEAAKGLLRETRLPVQAVCQRVGYSDIKHFTRSFRAETGITPGEFRKLYG